MNLKRLNFSDFVFALISFSTLYILIYNIFFYSPILGYDGEAHYNYVNYFSRYLPYEIKIPSMEDTREFFSPPLGYLIPSLAQVVCRNVISSNNFLIDCQPIYGKVTQIFQSLMFIVTIFINLYTLKLFNKSKSFFNASYLILISLLAVNYRTISMVRGEPYILFFLSIFILLIFKIEKNDFNPNPKLIIFSGITITCIALSRQWGFFLFLPLLILLFGSDSKIKYFNFWSASAFIGFLGSSWFYISLYNRYGSLTAFNMESKGFSLSNQEPSFYFPNLSHFQYLFSKPIRPNLDNQFFSILYSDLWGDYWGYFVFTSRFLDVGRNQLNIGDYLARVNILSVFTSILIVSFCFLTYKHYKQYFLIKYINLAIIVSFIGFLLFTVAYPSSTGDTIKATYIIQVFHLMAFSSSIYFQKLKKSHEKMFNVILSILVLIYFHNFGSFLSHFPINYIN